MILPRSRFNCHTIILFYLISKNKMTTPTTKKRYNLSDKHVSHTSGQFIYVTLNSIFEARWNHIYNAILIAEEKNSECVRYDECRTLLLLLLLWTFKEIVQLSTFGATHDGQTKLKKLIANSMKAMRKFFWNIFKRQKRSLSCDTRIVTFQT